MCSQLNWSKSAKSTVGKNLSHKSFPESSMRRSVFRLVEGNEQAVAPGRAESGRCGQKWVPMVSPGSSSPGMERVGVLETWKGLPGRQARLARRG
jgi:hypothetical protein